MLGRIGPKPSPSRSSPLLASAQPRSVSPQQVAVSVAHTTEAARERTANASAQAGAGRVESLARAPLSVVDFGRALAGCRSRPNGDSVTSTCVDSAREQLKGSFPQTDRPGLSAPGLRETTDDGRRRRSDLYRVNAMGAQFGRLIDDEQAQADSRASEADHAGCTRNLAVHL